MRAIRIPHEPNAERSRTDVCGEWQVEQLSEITGDPSTRGNQVKCRLSVPTCKAAFMDSQRVEQLGVGQAAANSAQTVRRGATTRDLPGSQCPRGGRCTRGPEPSAPEALGAPRATDLAAACVLRRCSRRSLPKM